jgi:hypothetical protein
MNNHCQSADVLEQEEKFGTSTGTGTVSVLKNGTRLNPGLKATIKQLNKKTKTAQLRELNT